MNTASRLEAITKTTGRSIRVSESTHDALLNPPHDLSFVGELDVRGRQSKILDLETLVHVGRFAVVAALISLLAAACAAAIPERSRLRCPAPRPGDPPTEKLAQVVARGTPALSTHLRYPGEPSNALDWHPSR